MEKFLLVTVPMILLAAAVYITHLIDGDSSKRHTPAEVVILQDGGSDSSPIVVGDGSINVRQRDYLIHEIDGFHAFVSLVGHKAVKVSDGYCPNPTDPEHDTPWASCTHTAKQYDLTAPWNIQLIDSTNKVVGNIGASDKNFEGLVIFSTIDKMHTIVGREPDNGSPGDGEGFVECAAGASKCSTPANLASATLSLNDNSAVSKPLCPSLSANQHCILQILYCNQKAIDGSNCK